MKSQLENAKNLALILFGNTIYAAAVTMFILPNNLITGGTTGMALLLFHQLGIPVSAFVSVFNIAMFFLGLAVLGRKFALTTLISSFYYPAALELLQKVPQLQGMTTDPLLATVFSGLMIGLGIGIVIKAGASTGGMDIPPLVLNKKIGLPVSVGLYVFDTVILIAQMLFSDKERVLYGILLVVLYTLVLDKILLMGQSGTQVKIISEKYEEINQAIINTLDRGSTLIHAETGYRREELPIVLTVISNRELTRLNQIVMEIDSRAFMVVCRVNEVKGRGFSMGKVYK